MATEFITGPAVEEVVTALPTFNAWQDAQNRLKIALESIPNRIDIENATHLRAQLALLDIREAVQTPHNLLLKEVATATSALSLPHRLGILAVLNNPLESHKGLLLHQPNFLLGLPSALPRSNEDIPRSEFAEAPADPFERAAKLGNEIIAVAEALKSNETTPVTELRLSRNLRFTTLRRYYKVTKDGYKVSEPEIVEDKLIYDFPSHLYGIEVYYNAETEETIPKTRKECSIEIPRIAQLRGSETVGRLILGRFESGRNTQRTPSRTPRARSRRNRDRHRR